MRNRRTSKTVDRLGRGLIIALGAVAVTACTTTSGTAGGTGTPVGPHAVADPAWTTFDQNGLRTGVEVIPTVGVMLPQSPGTEDLRNGVPTWVFHTTDPVSAARA